MSMRKLESLLALLGEAEKFSPAGDTLTQMIAETEHATDELNENELEWVAAARRDPEQQLPRSTETDKKGG